MSYVFGFFRVDGVRQLTHHDAAVYSARRFEMLEIVEKSLYYLIDRPIVHSELSGLPYMVIFNQIKLFCSLCYFINSAICYYDDPNHEIFTCFCRGNLDFVSSVSCSTICYYDDPNHEIFTCFCRGNLDLCYFVSSVSCSTILPIETSSPV